MHANDKKKHGKTNNLKHFLLDHMSDQEASNEPILPDLLDMKYEYVFRTLGRLGKYSLELKCLLLILILCIPCLIINSLSGAFPGTLPIYFIEGWGHFLASIFTGIFAWFLIRFLRRIDEKIRHVNMIISPPKSSENRKITQENEKRSRQDKEWFERKRWDEKIEEYKEWARRLASHKWYYFDTIGGAVCGFVIGMYLVGPAHGWAQGELFKELYLRSWYIFYGFFVGACLHYILGGYNAIRKYCKDMVPYGKLLPLDPDQTGGLRELGRLSLDLDLIVAIPSIAFPIYLLRFKLFEFLGREMQNIDTSSEIHAAIVLSVLYAFLLVLIFFATISPAHDDMVKAKTEYLLKIHGEYKDMHKQLLKKLDTKKHIEPVEYNRLEGLYKLYDRIESMAVWPLDFRTTVRFFITSLLPLISIGITISL